MYKLRCRIARSILTQQEMGEENSAEVKRECGVPHPPTTVGGGQYSVQWLSGSVLVS